MLDNEEQIKRIWDTLDRVGERLDKVGSRLDKIAKESGSFQNNDSEQLETEFVEAVRAKGQIGDAKVHDVHHSLRDRYEYDVVALNDHAVFVGEIKKKFLPQDVAKFVNDRLPHFADDFPKYADGRKVYGMIGGGSIVKDAVAEAKKHGLIVLRLQNGLQTENTEHARAF